ncbi:hypothetical protein [Lactococcus garvieae]|uniref:hypothetical protein n=1 Tax=Lactococcus garvieae TaxID=1363 RepID=UPI0015D86162|nr:hypothetical protein [Lactococcus garvieae]
MTFTNNTKNFKYTVSLDTSTNLFKASLVSISAPLSSLGNTIEEAVYNLEAIA